MVTGMIDFIGFLAIGVLSSAEPLILASSGTNILASGEQRCEPLLGRTRFGVLSYVSAYF